MCTRVIMLKCRKESNIYVYYIMYIYCITLLFKAFGKNKHFGKGRYELHELRYELR